MVRWANLPADETAEQELRLAEREITTSAIAALPDLAAEHGVSDEVLNRLAADFQEHLELVQARQRDQLGRPHAQVDAKRGELEALVPGKETLPREQPAGAAVQEAEYAPLARNEEYTRLRVAMLDRKREVLLRLRRDGSIDDSVARRVQTRLGVEELRLTGVEPLE